LDPAEACGNRKLVCSGCGRKLEARDVSEREVRDLPCMEFRTTVVVEVFRVCCPDYGIKVEKVPQLPGKAPFSKRFEDAVGQACEIASARQVAQQFGLVGSTVRAIDLRYLSGGRLHDGSQRWCKWVSTKSTWGRTQVHYGFQQSGYR
jgi:hypothetical protein